MATEIPFWDDDPLAWDQLKINGKLVPGRARITVKRGNRLDRRKAPKQHQEVLVDQGQPAADGEIQILLGFDSAPGAPFGTAREQWKAWQALEAELFGSKPGSRKAYIVEHPKFQWAKISQVYLEDPMGLDEDGPGARTITIGWHQYGRVTVGEPGAVKAGPIKPKLSTDIRTLANVKRPSAENVKP